MDIKGRQGLRQGGCVQGIEEAGKTILSGCCAMLSIG